LKSDKSIAKNKHKRVNKSQEIMKKANIFINREKTENQNNNNKPNIFFIIIYYIF
jgi:hypothetical protein